MNLLGNAQNDSIKQKIMNALSDIGINETEFEIANLFFDFSNEMDLSLLDKLTKRKLDKGRYERNSIMLFIDLQKMPKDKSFEFTDRYILFLDAIAGNTIGAFLSNTDYFFYDTYSELSRIRHAYELRYPKEEIEPRILALSSYGMKRNRNFSEEMLGHARNDPADLYKAGKYCLFHDNIFSKARLYSLALAYRRETDLSDSELKEMEKYLLSVLLESQSIHSTDSLELAVLLLFLGASYGSKIKNCLKKRLTLNMESVVSSILQYIPHDYFENHMDLLADMAEASESISVQSVIEQAVSSAVSCDAFKYKNAGCQAQNSTGFLSFLAKKYPEAFISVMLSEKPLSAGLRSGYYFDYYDEMKDVLTEAVPDAEEKYHLDGEKGIVEQVIHRELITSDASLRTQIMTYLEGNAGISIFNDIISKIVNNKQTNHYADIHEINMLAKLKKYPDFYNRFVALKLLQNSECIKYYILRLFNNDKSIVSDEIKSIFRAAVKENVPLETRIMLFEMIYSNNEYFDDRKKLITEAIVDIMAENEEKYDSEYEKECLDHQIYTCCCYIKYLDKTNSNNKNKNRLLALSGESSKEIRRTLVAVLAKHKEYRPEIMDMLTAKKQAVRETAVDTISMWGIEGYREELEQAANNEKSVKLADKIRSLLSSSLSVSENGDSIFSPAAFVEDIHKGGRAKKIAWLYDSPMPEVHFNNGSQADEKYLQALLLCYSTMPAPDRNGNAFLLAAELNEGELKKYAAEIFDRWYAAGAESKTKWAMYFAVIHGGDEMVEVALKCIKDWAENMRGAIAAEAVKAISFNGSAYALMTVDNLAHKFKQKQVKKAASEAMENAAVILGITADELGDRIVPNLGFDENMERIFDYGERKFKVYLSARLELEVFDENGKKLKTLPAPGKKDNEEIAKQSNTEFKALKKQLKNVISIQKLRLETALLADRKWKKKAWIDLFVKNPVMHSFAIGLIWAAYTENDCTTFRYMEDGTFNTVDEDEFELPEECKIGLVHPIELDEDEINAWKEQLDDYEIIQPINQINKTIYRIKDDEIGKLDLDRFNGKNINALTLMGRASKLGWSKGSPQDAGLFYVFYREDVTDRSKNPDGSFTLSGNAVELHFSGTYIAVENEEVTIENIRFYRPGTIEHGSYVYDEADDEKAIPLEKIPPRYFSEIILQLEEITK